MDFNFSRGNFKESFSKQARNYINLAKLLTCFDTVIENAVGIEVHNRNETGYKVDGDLKDVYVVISVFEDGNNVFLVKLEIKEFKNQANTLYVAITLDGIKKEEIVTQGDTAQCGVTQDAPSSKNEYNRFVGLCQAEKTEDLTAGWQVDKGCNRKRGINNLGGGSAY